MKEENARKFSYFHKISYLKKNSFKKPAKISGKVEALIIIKVNYTIPDAASAATRGPGPLVQCVQDAAGL